MFPAPCEFRMSASSTKQSACTDRRPEDHPACVKDERLCIRIWQSGRRVSGSSRTVDCAERPISAGGADIYPYAWWGDSVGAPSNSGAVARALFKKVRLPSVFESAPSMRLASSPSVDDRCILFFINFLPKSFCGRLFFAEKSYGRVTIRRNSSNRRAKVAKPIVPARFVAISPQRKGSGS